MKVTLTLYTRRHFTCKAATFLTPAQTSDLHELGHCESKSVKKMATRVAVWYQRRQFTGRFHDKCSQLIWNLRTHTHKHTHYSVGGGNKVIKMSCCCCWRWFQTSSKVHARHTSTPATSMYDVRLYSVGCYYIQSTDGPHLSSHCELTRSTNDVFDVVGLVCVQSCNSHLVRCQTCQNPVTYSHCWMYISRHRHVAYSDLIRLRYSVWTNYHTTLQI